MSKIRKNVTFVIVKSFTIEFAFVISSGRGLVTAAKVFYILCKNIQKINPNVLKYFALQIWPEKSIKFLCMVIFRINIRAKKT